MSTTRASDVPFNRVMTDQEGLSYLECEISYGGQWISLNDNEKFRINGQNSRDQSAKTWRKITAQSPVLGGTYLVHAVPEMITETVAVWVYGISQTDLSDNFFFLDGLFEQASFRIRWTFNEYREYWDCQLADATYTRGQVFTHSQMAMTSYSVPRFPRVSRERL